MVKFGIAGMPESFSSCKSVTSAAKLCNDLGIDLFEYSFGHGCHMLPDTAKIIGNAYKQFNVEISVHAPYFINFSNPNSISINKSINYILESISTGRLMGANRVVVHPASCCKMERSKAFSLALDNFTKLSDALDEHDITDFQICMETMGKHAQIGTVDEIIQICNKDRRFFPCIDFGHINAREHGLLSDFDNFDIIIRKLLNELPDYKVSNLHTHFSKVQYGEKGELCHLTFENDVFGPEFEPFVESLINNNIDAHVICESDGTQDKDTLLMKAYYFTQI
jgi:deoxyribonuclease-4